MGRLLFLLLVAAIVVWYLRRPEKPAGARRGSGDGGDLVACARCGVHLPRSEACAARGALYCSDEHARLGKV